MVAEMLEVRVWAERAEEPSRSYQEKHNFNTAKRGEERRVEERWRLKRTRWMKGGIRRKKGGGGRSGGESG